MSQLTEKNSPQENSERLKPYSKPEVLHDLDIETRAGSPFVVPIDPWDPTNLSDF